MTATALLTEASLSLTRDRYERRNERRIAAYFRRWARAFPSEALAADITKRRLREAENPDDADYLEAVAAAWFASDEFTELVFDVYLVTGNGAGASALRSLRIAGGFELRGERVLSELRSRSARQVADIDEFSQRRIRELLARGIERGAHPFEIARNLRGEFSEWSVRRAQTIARTETAWAWSSVTHESFLRNGITARRWESIQADPGEQCAVNEAAGDVPIDEPFPSGHDYPPAHPSCLPGDALVLAEGVAATSQRYYHGDLVIIRTASGKLLRCTPNHPILTPHGWLAAGALHEGGYVIRRLRREWNGASNPDHDDVPARIEQVARAFRSALGVTARRVPVAPEDFDGDGLGSDVAIIWTDGLLQSRLDAALAEYGGEVPLRLRDVRLTVLSGGCPPAKFLEARLAATVRNVGSGDLRCAALAGHRLPLDALSLALRTGLYLGLDEMPADYVASYPEAVGQRFLGLPGGIVGDDTRGQGMAATLPRSAHHLRPRVQLDARLPEQAHHRVPTLEPEGASDLQSGLTGLIAADKVIHVERVRFSGHVYNLQTASGWYEAESIVTHNCRCSVIASALPGWEPPEVPWRGAA